MLKKRTFLARFWFYECAFHLYEVIITTFLISSLAPTLK
jgi:hypothetical protein